MKRILVTLALAIGLTAAGVSEAAWIWTPDLGKWINPKKAAKDTPEKQFAWALQFYEKRDWDRAIEEFEKIPDAFPSSRMAAEGVYYAGLSWEEKKDDAKAADAFQKLIDRYPYSDRIKDAIRHEFDIANRFADGARMKVLGVPALPGQDKALELYNHIVKNAPFGTYGDQAQFKIGELYKAQGEFVEAQKAFQAVVDEYPSSELVAKARYQIAYCSMQASKAAQYNDKYAERAIEEFQGFKENFPQDAQAVEAEESIRALREKKAKNLYEIGWFYERQKKWASAKTYYSEIVSKYPDTRTSAQAKRKLDGLIRTENEPAKPKFHLW